MVAWATCLPCASSTCSPRPPAAATRSRCSTTPTTCPTSRWPRSPVGPTSPRRRSSAPRPTRPPTTGADLDDRGRAALRRPPDPRQRPRVARGGGRPASEGVVVQECGAGLVEVRRRGDRLAFAAPPLVRSGPVEPGEAARLVGAARPRPGGRRRPRLGRQRPRLGRRAAPLDGCRARRRPGPRPVGGSQGRARRGVRTRFPGRRGGGRGAGLLLRRPRLHGGPRDRKPQRGAGAVARPGRPPPAGLRGRAGHGDRP